MSAGYPIAPFFSRIEPHRLGMDFAVIGKMALDWKHSPSSEFDTIREKSHRSQ
jgi:hypothetical protein